jgi:hypothetical protein
VVASFKPFNKAKLKPSRQKKWVKQNRGVAVATSRLLVV